MRILVILIGGLIFLAACADEPAPTPVPPTATAGPTVIPTATPIPLTSTPVPTPTVTSTPSPTATPTVTPTPTQTPTPPPPTPTPVFDPGPIILPTVAIPSRTATPTPTVEELLSRKLDAIGFRAALVRDLSGTGPVDRAIIGTQEMEQMLFDDLEEDRDELSVTQKLYELLRITEEGTDLIELLSDVYGDVVLGFFDTEDRKLYVVGDADEFNERDELTFAHEYVHGLQQAHYDIRALREAVEDNADQARAITAMIEGDATLAELIYELEHYDEEQQEAVRASSAEADFTAYLAAPTVIQQEIAFPYIVGRSFIIALYLENNSFELVDEAYNNPPVSTEQVIHPEKYVAEEAPVDVELSELADSLGKGWTEIRRDTFGEAFIRSYLTMALEGADSVEAAAGWGGDSFALYDGPEGATAMVAITAWDTEADADEFFDAYRPLGQVLVDGEWEAVDASPGTFAIRDDSREFLLSRSAPLQVLLVISTVQGVGLTVLEEINPASDPDTDSGVATTTDSGVAPVVDSGSATTTDSGAATTTASGTGS